MMILKTVTNEEYFASEFIRVAKNLISESDSPFNQNEQKDFLNLSVGTNIGTALYDFNYSYFAFPHKKRVGMFDEFDDYSEQILDKLINELEKFVPKGNKKLSLLYSLTCRNIIDLIIKDLEMLGDEEFIELIKTVEIKILSWAK